MATRQTHWRLLAVAGAASLVAACGGGGGDDPGPDNTATPPPAPTLSFSASSLQVQSGESVTLTWSSQNTTACSASGGWTGDKALDGSETISNMTQDAQLTLSCQGDGGAVSQTRSVFVDNPPPPMPSLTLLASPGSVALNAAATISWNSADATTCTASGDWSGSKPLSGSEQTAPLQDTAVFILSCDGPGGTAQESVTVQVAPGGGGGSATLSGKIDSSRIAEQGVNRVYVFPAGATPDDIDGDAGDPIVTADVLQFENSCEFGYAIDTLNPGDYTLAFTPDAASDQPGGNDSLSFIGTQQVTVDGNGTVANVGPQQLLQVGPGKQYADIMAAADALQDGGVIEVDAGVYDDNIIVFREDNIVVRGVGGRAHVRATQEIPFESGNDLKNGKGLFVTRGTDIRIENIEFSGVTVPSENGAGIRGEGRDLTVCNGYFHDNENGYLGEAIGTLTFEYSEFDNNGLGDQGFTHNVYVVAGSQQGDRLVFRYNNSRRANFGHALKTRARENIIVYNRLMDEATGNGSYNIDVPNGGRTFVIGNIIQQGPNSPNSAIIAYGAEGLSGGRDHELYLSHNTIVNDRFSGTFVQSNGGTTILESYNNIFYDAGSTYSGKSPTASGGNITGTSPSFVDRSNYDYRLNPGSAGIDGGVAVGAAAGQSLAPIYEYVDNAQREARPVDGAPDVGAYEAGN
ncbi:MAG: hypothetical protein AAGM16_04665 [Pseudomonadota bacterium]